MATFSDSRFSITFTICELKLLTCLLQQSPDELTEMAYKYYDEIALPKLVKLMVASSTLLSNYFCHFLIFTITYLMYWKDNLVYLYESVLPFLSFR